MRWIYPIDIEAWNGTSEDAHRISKAGRISETCPNGFTHDWKTVGLNGSKQATDVADKPGAIPVEEAPKRRGRPPKAK